MRRMNRSAAERSGIEVSMAMCMSVVIVELGRVATDGRVAPWSEPLMVLCHAHRRRCSSATLCWTFCQLHSSNEQSYEHGDKNSARSTRSCVRSSRRRPRPVARSACGRDKPSCATTAESVDSQLVGGPPRKPTTRGGSLGSQFTRHPVRNT